MSKKITIKEIAEKARVSPGTVDRVLHNRGEVSEITREKVLKIIKEGNYEPNMFARNLVLNKQYTIVSILPTFSTGDYWASQDKGIQQAHQELSVFGFNNKIKYFNESDPESFEKEAEAAIEEHPDGILLAPIIYHKAKRLTEKCVEKNIPVVIIDSNIPNVKKLSFIGQNAFKSGQLAAKLLEYGKGNNQYYLVTISKSTENNNILKQRKEGFLNYFESHGIKANIHMRDLYSEESDFLAQLNALIAGFSPGDKIFIPNSRVYLVATLLKENYPSLPVLLLGYDLIPKNVKHLKEGTIQFLINQKPEEQGYQGVQLLYKSLVLKQDVNEEVFMPLEIITRENIEYVSF